MSNLAKIAEKKIEEQVGTTAQILGYMEHQIDLVSQLVKDIAETIPAENRTPEMEERLTHLSALLEKTSVDFENIASPFETYKLPKAVKVKGAIRNIQKQYLKAKLREEGLL